MARHEVQQSMTIRLGFVGDLDGDVDVGGLEARAHGVVVCRLSRVDGLLADAMMVFLAVRGRIEGAVQSCSETAAPCYRPREPVYRCRDVEESESRCCMKEEGCGREWWCTI